MTAEPQKEIDLRATLEAGAAGEFFERVMASEDKVPTQLVSAEEMIDKAAASDNPDLQDWAIKMRSALEHSAEAEALELSMAKEASAGPLENITNMFSKFKDALNTALADGFQLSDLFTIFNALSGADPEAQELAAHRNAANNAMIDGEASLKHAEREGVDVKEALGGDAAEVIKDATDRIDRIAPSPPPASPPGPGGA